MPYLSLDNAVELKAIKVIFTDCPYPVEVFSALRKIAGLHDGGLSDSDSEPESMTVERGPLPDTPGEGGSVPDRVGETVRSKPLEPTDIEGSVQFALIQNDLTFRFEN